jgi:hypothetical protein
LSSIESVCGEQFNRLLLASADNSIKISAMDLAGTKANVQVQPDDFQHPNDSPYMLAKAKPMDHLLAAHNSLSADIQQ